MVVWAHTATEYNRASKLKLGKVSLPSHISLPPPIPIWEKRKERKCWRSPLACRTQLACQIGRAAGTPTCQLLLPLRYVPPGTMEELSFCFCFFFFCEYLCLYLVCFIIGSFLHGRNTFTWRYDWLMRMNRSLISSVAIWWRILEERFNLYLRYSLRSDYKIF
jgi:hypothetical protein